MAIVTEELNLTFYLMLIKFNFNLKPEALQIILPLNTLWKISLYCCVRVRCMHTYKHTSDQIDINGSSGLNEFFYATA